MSWNKGKTLDSNFIEYECTATCPFFFLSHEVIKTIDAVAPNLKWSQRLDVTKMLSVLTPYFYSNISSAPVRTWPELVTFSGAENVCVLEKAVESASSMLVSASIGTNDMKIHILCRINSKSQILESIKLNTHKENYTNKNKLV